MSLHLVTVCQKVPILDFQSEFSMSKIIRVFFFTKSWKIELSFFDVFACNLSKNWATKRYYTSNEWLKSLFFGRFLCNSRKLNVRGPRTSDVTVKFIKSPFISPEIFRRKIFRRKFLRRKFSAGNILPNLLIFFGRIFLTYNLLAIASFRIGVPLILLLREKLEIEKTKTT